MRARSLVVGIRVFFLVVAAGAVAAAWLIARAHDRATEQAAAQYVCPMHPDVTATGPGVCPICRMDLEPMRLGAAGAEGPSPAVGPSTYQTYDVVRRHGFGQDVRAPAWVDVDGTVAAILYKDVFATLTPGERCVFFPSATPGAGLAVHPAADPPESWDRATWRVRFRVDESEQAPPLGEIGWVRVAAKRREVPVIPFAAVLKGAEGQYVLVASQDNRTLSKRPVEIGRVLGGLAVIVSGLRFQERILVRSAFFVDAERRLRRQAAIEVTP
jgi:Heavy metal binding domain